MWKLKSLIDHSKTVSAEINGKWVPCRPINDTRKYASLRSRFRNAWEVFMCRAEAFKWPEGQ